MSTKILHINRRRSEQSCFEHTLVRLSESGFPGTVTDGMPESAGGISLIHAHSWVADGAIAYRLHQQFGTPYILSVGETDAESAHRLTTWHTNKKILQEAEHVIITNPMSERFLTDRLPEALSDIVFSHTVTIYDSIDPFWLSDLHLSQPVSKVNMRLLFVLEGDNLRYLAPVVKSIMHIRRQNLDYTLTLAGLPDVTEAVWRAAETQYANKEFIRLVRCESAGQLKAQFRAHDLLAMPCASDTRTGIYAQAISQGLPVLYAKGGCFDGIFAEGDAGYAVQPNHTEDIENKMLLIRDRYATIMQHLSDLHPLLPFDVEENIRKYLRIYQRFN